MELLKDCPDSELSYSEHWYEAVYFADFSTQIILLHSRSFALILFVYRCYIRVVQNACMYPISLGFIHPCRLAEYTSPSNIFSLSFKGFVMDFFPLSTSDDTIILKYSNPAYCGEPRSVSEDIDTEIHFGKYWVPNPRDSYSIIAKGDSMIEAKIFDGDMLVINCSLEPQQSNVVVAWLNGELTIKRLGTVGSSAALLPANPAFQPILVREDDDFKILGVVTSVHRHIK